MTSTKRDYYEVLGLARTADDEAIKRAFRALARELHPDVSEAPEAEERFRELSAAYSVLSEPKARLLYDRFGYVGLGNGVFGSDAGHGGPPRVLAEVELDVFEAERGARREVHLPAHDQCEVCGGERVAPGSERRSCETCGGEGRVRVSSGLGIGRWLRIETCPDCENGRRLSRPCPACEGTGRIRRDRVVKVRIPPGVDDGTRLRMLGEPEHEHLLVRVLPLPDESRLVRYSATVLLVLALALFAYFVRLS